MLEIDGCRFNDQLTVVRLVMIAIHRTRINRPPLPLPTLRETGQRLASQGFSFLFIFFILLYAFTSTLRSLPRYLRVKIDAVASLLFLPMVVFTTEMRAWKTSRKKFTQVVLAYETNWDNRSENCKLEQAKTERSRTRAHYKIKRDTQHFFYLRLWLPQELFYLARWP